MISLPILNNSDATTCTECGGQCCKRCPGTYAPQQILDILKEYKATGVLRKGLTIRNVDDPRNKSRDLRVIRPAKRYEITDDWMQYECVNLTNTGCSLKFEERPIECQSLVPRETPESSCHATDGYDTDDVARMWIKFQKYLK
jgi:Fe-S-cluster containining protein